jgi:hypothetical protein
MKNNYNKIVEQEERNVSEKAIAQNIYTLIYNIRQRKTDIGSQRRWIWELLQNAQDTIIGDRKSIVEINLNEEEKYLEFKHNGNPFSVKNITHLVNQQSSKLKITKEGSIEKTTGKYGTGFITTHLLSEIVTVKSIIKEDNLEYRLFELELDRSGEDEDELFKSVTKSMKILREIDSLEELKDFDINSLNTTFRYELDEEGIEIAKIGLSDLSVCLPYTMAFMPKLQTVRVNKNDTFENESRKDFAENIEIITICHNKNKIKFLLANSDSLDASICFPFEDVKNKEYKLLRVNEECPRIFCNFPLIGTEDFELPFVMNSSSFTPYDEKRNGINLTETNTTDIIKNKSLVDECIEIYIKLASEISKLSNWSNLFELANFGLPEKKEWLSEKWYEENILDYLAGEFISIPIVETVHHGRRAIVEGKTYVDFPHHNKKIRERIWNLCNIENWFVLPIKEHIHEWDELNWWDSKYNLSLINLINFVGPHKNIKALSDKIKMTEKECFKWLEMLYSIIVEDSNLLALLNKYKTSIFPNQNGDFVAKHTLYWDNGEIGEELKDILLKLGYDIRKDLLEESIFIDGELAIDSNKEKTGEDIATMISKRVTTILASKITGRLLTELEKEAFKDLYLWLINNSKAEDYFGELYTNKHRLCDEEDIALAMENSNRLDNLLDETGLTFEELEMKLFESNKVNKNKDNKLSTLDWLINLGIHSNEQLEEILSNPKFKHISNANLEMLQKVLLMIERAKKNVKQHLLNLPEYDCTNWKEIDITVISGIKKNNLPITLVIRPSDGGQVIFYYSHEKFALEDLTCELWVDNGKEQKNITIGSILKANEIDKIYV